MSRPAKFDAYAPFEGHRLGQRAFVEVPDLQIAALEAQFVEDGGYSEKLAAARLVERNRRKNRTDPSDKIPPCPKCGSVMVLRTAHKGNQPGRQFWGCSAYPACRGLLDV